MNTFLIVFLLHKAIWVVGLPDMQTCTEHKDAAFTEFVHGWQRGGGDPSELTVACELHTKWPVVGEKEQEDM